MLIRNWDILEASVGEVGFNVAFKPSMALLESHKTIGFLLEDMNFDREEARQRCNLRTDK